MSENSNNVAGFVSIIPASFNQAIAQPIPITEDLECSMAWSFPNTPAARKQAIVHGILLFWSFNEEPRRKQRGIKILETRRILSAASCGEYNPK